MRGGRIYPLLCQCRAVGPQHQPGSGRREALQAGDGEVFVVEIRVVAKNCVRLIDASVGAAKLPNAAWGRGNLLHDWENPRLRIVIPIGSNAEINLLVEGIGLVRGYKRE